MFKQLPLLLAIPVLLQACGADGTEAERGPLPEEAVGPAVGKVGPDGTYHAYDGRFFIRFPEEPTHTVERVDRGGSSLLTHFFVAQYSDSLACMVAYTDHPHDVVQNGGHVQIIEGAVQGAIEPLGIDVPAEIEEIRINGHPGLQIIAQRDHMHMNAMFLMVRERLYQVTVLSFAGTPPEEISADFFGSLHLAEEPAQPVEDWFPFEEMDPEIMKMIQQ